MSLGIVYLIVFVVSVVCGLLSINRPNGKLNALAGLVMVAGCVYATYFYSWFHILGIVGITLVGLNVFSALKMIRQGRENEKARIDELFKTDYDDEEVEDKEVK